MTDDFPNDGGDFCRSLKDADAQDRIGFVKKVYSILFAQLLLTGICIAVTITNDSICLWMLEYWWIYLILIFVALFIEILVICVRPLGRKVPMNYILLFLFTLCEAYLLSFASMTYSFTETCDEFGRNCVYDFSNRETVTCAGIGTVAITAACTAYACTTKTDFTKCWAVIWVAGMSFFILCIFSIFFWSRIFNIMISVLGVFLFGVYLIFDTQYVMGGKRYQLSLDDYIVGALILYMDIIMIFLYLLSLFGGR